MKNVFWFCLKWLYFAKRVLWRGDSLDTARLRWTLHMMNHKTRALYNKSMNINIEEL